jgi:peptidyl-prolyl cis-trans isomerase A (cyclophilin A)
MMGSPHRRRLFFVACCTIMLLACDSRQRGENQTAATDDRPPTEAPGSATDLEPDDDETGHEPPEPSALDRYLEDIEGDGPLQVTIDTTRGDIECELFPEQAPITVANFVGLARGLKAFVDHEIGEPISGIPYYDGVEFHRVIPGFLIQTGDRTGQGHGNPGYAIPDEFSEDLRHDQPGMLSMANRGPDTGGSQFFITEQAAPHLDDRHTIFGKCESQNIIRSISHVPTEGMNRPVDPKPRINRVEFHRD